MVLNIVSELSRFPHFQSRWLRGPNSIEFISHFILFAERMTCSCTTVWLQLYNYIGYGRTTLELWLYNYKGLSCTTTEFCFFEEIQKSEQHTDLLIITFLFHVFNILAEIFSNQKYWNFKEFSSGICKKLSF